MDIKGAFLGVVQGKLRHGPLCVVVSCFSITALGATLFVYAQHSQGEHVDFSDRYPNLSPSAAYVETDDLIVDFQELRESLNNQYENRDDYLVSLYFEYLPTGANISVNRDALIWPASLIKIPVAMAAMKKIQDGDWKLSNELVILDEDKDSEFGSLYEEPTGTTLSIEQLLHETLANSDNTAHFVLLRNLDGSEIEDVYVHLGMDDIIDAIKHTPRGQEADNRITSKRYSIFFRSLYNATYLTPEYSQLFLTMLGGAPRENLSTGLPDGIPFFHKTGIRTDERVWADAGIVYVPGRPYLLTVMIQKKGSESLDAGQREEVDAIFSSVSRQIYDYVAKGK